jgi:ribonuclease-3
VLLNEVTDTSRLIGALNYQFKDPTILEQALTHRSAGGFNNERLEFLGDAILGFVVADELYRRFPEADEGQLTRLRASLVNKRTLAEIGRALRLGDELKLGEGELKSGGWRRESILANALEAILGAIYLDGGMDDCKRVILTTLAAHFDSASPEANLKDAKTRLQEYLQGRGEPLPEYETVDISGAAHQQTFTVQCSVRGMSEPIIAQGNSRRIAEQAAAQAMLQRLGEQNHQ